MQIFTKSKIEIDIEGLSRRIANAVRRTDSNGKPLAYSEVYVLKKIKHGMDDPYFFGGGNFHAPDMVMGFDEAMQLKGDQLNFTHWDWTKDWVAIPVKSVPNDELSTLRKKFAQTETREEIPDNIAPSTPSTPSTPQAQVAPENPAANPAVNPLDGKTNDQARKIVRNLVFKPSLGLFSDQYWEGPQRVFSAMNQANLDWYIESTQYGVSKTMQETFQGEKWRIPNDYKEWKFHVKFTNRNQKPTIIYGILTAHGAGSISDPLSKYDMSVIIG